MGDILTVPFAPEELLARVIARMRRSYSDAVTFTPVIKIGELEIDILKRTVLTGALELHLTHSSKACCTCWQRTLAEWSAAMRS